METRDLRLPLPHWPLKDCVHAVSIASYPPRKRLLRLPLIPYTASELLPGSCLRTSSAGICGLGKRAHPGPKAACSCLHPRKHEIFVFTAPIGYDEIVYTQASSPPPPAWTRDEATFRTKPHRAYGGLGVVTMSSARRGVIKGLS